VRTLLVVLLLGLMTATATAGKKPKAVKFQEWTPPEKCIVDRGGVDDEGDHNAGLSRRVLDKKNVDEFLPDCDVGIDWKKYRLVRIQMVSNVRTVKSAATATIKKGKIIIEIVSEPICSGHDVYRRSLLWVLLPKGKMNVQAVQPPIPDDDPGCAKE
jgi:hypothetical protein